MACRVRLEDVEGEKREDSSVALPPLSNMVSNAGAAQPPRHAALSRSRTANPFSLGFPGEGWAVAESGRQSRNKAFFNGEL